MPKTEENATNYVFTGTGNEAKVYMQIGHTFTTNCILHTAYYFTVNCTQIEAYAFNYTYYNNN